MPDHVHMLIQLQPTVPLPKAVQYLKGGSSKIIRKVFPVLEEWLWGDSLCADGVFAEAVGRASEEAMKNLHPHAVSAGVRNKLRPLGRR
ncbi:MAG: transposase [Planctomycetes bacterium]|nr:transposase [Planctomycetota bacterium]